MYTIGVLLYPAYKQWPNFATRSKWVGVPLMAVGLISASFASSVKYMALTQGVLYALGGSAVYYPSLALLDEWFIRRKGFAYGVMWVSGAVPFSLQ